MARVGRVVLAEGRSLLLLLADPADVFFEVERAPVAVRLRSSALQVFGERR